MYKILAIIGQSGSGKDTLKSELLAADANLYDIINCTTRPKRKNECDGVNYYFYTPEVFGEKLLNGELIECTSFNDWFYGTSYEAIRSNGINIGVFNPTGIESLLSNSQVEIKIIYVQASDKTRLMRQLNREENPDVDEIIRRYKTDKEDFYDINFPHISVINEKEADIEKNVEYILSIIKSWT